MKLQYPPWNFNWKLNYLTNEYFFNFFRQFFFNCIQLYLFRLHNNCKDIIKTIDVEIFIIKDYHFRLSFDLCYIKRSSAQLLKKFFIDNNNLV